MSRLRSTVDLDVGDGHRLHVELAGASDSRPVLYVHGGPGSGCTLGARQLIDPTRHLGVFVDQRSAGRSTPHASEEGVDWGAIDLEHHLSDLEAVREHLGIRALDVIGLSWGSVLGLAYAERHPQRVTGLVLGAVSTGTRADVDWITSGVGGLHPDEHAAFIGHLPAGLRSGRPVDGYAALLHDPDPDVREAAATAWCHWEDVHVMPPGTSRPADGTFHDRRYEDPRFRLGFARQVTHAWRHDSWLEPGQLLRDAGRLAAIPGSVVHGRHDLSSPLDRAQQIHAAWPGSDLAVVGTRHGGDELMAACRAALSRLAP